MTIFNTYWTVSYFLMLAFVFITLLVLGIRWMFKGRDTRHWQLPLFCCFAWAALGTHFFHCIW